MVEGRQGKKPFYPPRNTRKKEEFKAPTYEYKHMIFKQGTTKDVMSY